MDSYSSPRGTELRPNKNDDDSDGTATSSLLRYAGGDSVDARPRPKRPARHSCCCCMLTKWVIAAVAATVVTIVVTTIVVLVFVAGQQLAAQQLKDSEIVIEMAMSNPTDTTFDVHVTGYMDNRGTAGATLFPSILSMIYENQEIGQVPFPKLIIEGGGKTQLDVLSTVTVTNLDALTSFCTTLLRENTTVVTLHGAITVTSLGITFSNVDFTKQVTLQGFADFTSPPARVLSQDVVGGTPDTLIMKIVTELYNQASVSFEDLGLLNLTLMYGDVVLGYGISTSNVSLLLGRNLLEMEGLLIRTPENSATLDFLLGCFTSGVDLTLIACGNNQSTTITLLRPALANMFLTISFPSLFHLEDKLLQGGYAYWPTIDAMFRQIDKVACNFTLSHVYADIYVYAKNPMNITLNLDDFGAQIDWEGDRELGIEPMALAVARSYNLGIALPPLGNAVFQQRVCVVTSGKLPFALDKFVRHHDVSGKMPFFLWINVTGDVRGHCQQFPITLRYVQHHIPVTSIAHWPTSSPTTSHTSAPSPA